MKYEVSYVEHGHADSQNPYGLKLLLGRLSEPLVELLFFQATRGDADYRVSWRRRWARELYEVSEMEALRSFLHTSGLPSDLNWRDIVIKKITEEMPVEDDGECAGEAA